MDKKKVLVTARISNSLLAFLEKNYDVTKAGSAINNNFPLSENDMTTMLKDISIFICQMEVVTEKVLKSAKFLELIICMRGSGADKSIKAIEYLTSRKIPLAYTPGRNSRSVAEYTLAQIINSIRKISLSNYMIENKLVPVPKIKNLKVPQTSPLIYDDGFLHPTNTVTGKRALWMGKDLEQSIIGIVGCGHVGKELINMLSNLNTKEILVSTKHPENHKDIELKPNVKLVNLDDLLSHSDIVILAYNGNLIFNNILVSKMKKNSVLINIAKPEMVDLNALIDGLKKNILDHVILDAVNYEQIEKVLSFNDKMKKLKSKKKIFTTGYIAGSSINEVETASNMVIKILSSFSDGYSIPYIWNAEGLNRLYNTNKYYKSSINDSFEDSIKKLKEVSLFLKDKGYLKPGSSSGNISLRNPSNYDEMIITLSGESLDNLKDGCKSFCKLSLNNNDLETKSIDWTKWDLKKKPLIEYNADDFLENNNNFTLNPSPCFQGKPSSFETWMHWSIFKNIKGVNAIVHLHSPNSVAFATMNPCFISELREKCRDSFPENDTANIIPYVNVARTVKCGPILWCPDFPAASNELHSFVWRVLKQNKAVAVLLQNHGVLTIGSSIKEAAAVAAEVEQELGIILDCIKLVKDKDLPFNFISAKNVEWNWKNLTKGCSWRKIYNIK